MKTQRNDPCPCGSGKKFKKCCQGAQDAAAPKVVLPSGEMLDKLPEPQKGKSIHRHGPSCNHGHHGHGHGHDHDHDEKSTPSA